MHDFVLRLQLHYCSLTFHIGSRHWVLHIAVEENPIFLHDGLHLLATDIHNFEVLVLQTDDHYGIYIVVIALLSACITLLQF